MSTAYQTNSTADIRENQPLQLVIWAHTAIDNGVDTVKVKYKDPDGTEDLWDGTAGGDNNEYITVNIAGNVLTPVGRWYVHSYVTFAGDAAPTLGKRASFFVREEFERNS